MILHARCVNLSLSSLFSLIFLACLLPLASAQTKNANHPWMNPSLSPDDRASMVLKEMTIDEKISLLHGTGMEGLSPLSPEIVHSNGGAGYTVGIPRLEIPP